MKPQPSRAARSSFGRKLLMIASVAWLFQAPPIAAAHDAPPPQNLLSFSTTATMEVTQDLLTVNLQVVRDGTDATQVQAQLKQVLDAALAEARKNAQPGAMEVRTGNFSLYPRHGKDGKINGWQGQAELVLEGKDVARIAQTAGKLQGMNITGAGYSISRELADKYAAEVTAQAVQKYRAQAAELAKQFGFGSYTLREVSVQQGEHGGRPPRPMMARAAEFSVAAAPLPTEAGTGTITATVNGTVQLTR